MQALGQDPAVTLIQVNSAAEAVAAARRISLFLAVIDPQIDGDNGLALIRQLMQINAFIHTAVLTDMEEEEFHELGEGLGIMMRLPLTPNGEDAGELLSRLRDMMPDR